MGTLRRNVTRAWAAVALMLSTPVFGKKKIEPQHKAPPPKSDERGWRMGALFLRDMVFDLCAGRVAPPAFYLRHDTKLHYHHRGHRHAAARRKRAAALSRRALRSAS